MESGERVTIILIPQVREEVRSIAGIGSQFSVSLFQHLKPVAVVVSGPRGWGVRTTGVVVIHVVVICDDNVEKHSKTS